MCIRDRLYRDSKLRSSTAKEKFVSNGDLGTGEQRSGPSFDFRKGICLPVRKVSPQMIIQEIFQILSPLVAHTRAQSDLVTLVQGFTHKSYPKTRRQSHKKKMIEVLLMKNENDQNLETYLKNKQQGPYIEELTRFIPNLLMIAECRGLDIGTILPCLMTERSNLKFQLKISWDKGLRKKEAEGLTCSNQTVESEISKQYLRRAEDILDDLRKTLGQKLKKLLCKTWKRTQFTEL
eukprot:TRINITY_DN8120_c0_g1_i1.p1 TRINITY_DN8120_c0_g1~~TRINITY_DN8120_c0_g1_i1.p1  ORF type:complete len:260 (-),score=52.71 TRINITY_DN8120_c0_g1_i1:114-818(-)